MHMGAVSAELGLGGWPSLGESLVVSRELSLAGDTRPAAPPDAPLGARVGRACSGARASAGVRASGEVTPHHLVPHRRGRALARPEPEDEPAAAAPSDDRAALIDALRDGTIEAIATDHAPHSREEKDVPFEAAPFGVTGLETAFAALYTPLVEPGLLPLETLLERMSAGPARDLRPRPAADRRRRAGEPRAARARTATWRVREERFRSRSRNSWLLGQRLHGQGAR